MLPDALPHAALRRASPEGVALSHGRSGVRAGLLDSGGLAAGLLRGTCWGDVWLIAADDVLGDHSDIERSGLPVVRFAELPHLQRLDADALRTLGLVKRTFPTARVLQ